MREREREVSYFSESIHSIYPFRISLKLHQHDNILAFFVIKLLSYIQNISFISSFKVLTTVFRLPVQMNHETEPNIRLFV